jgi:hypothetical protein
MYYDFAHQTKWRPNVHPKPLSAVLHLGTRLLSKRNTLHQPSPISLAHLTPNNKQTNTEKVGAHRRRLSVVGEVKRTTVSDRRDVGGGVHASGGERGGVPLLAVPYPRQSGLGA